LARFRIGTHRSPIALSFIALVRDRAFDDQDEGGLIAFRGKTEGCQEIIPVLVGKKGIVKMHLRDPGQRTALDILNARLCRRGHGDRVPVTSKTGRDPEDIDFRDRLRSLRFARSNRRALSHASPSKPLSTAYFTHSSGWTPSGNIQVLRKKVTAPGGQ
jgi:hypothetical protein